MDNDALADAIEKDHPTAELSDREKRILDYAVKLTREPSNMREEDVVALRETGLSDAEILDVCQVTSYYNYVNRLADGLGVELEPPRPPPTKIDQ